MPRSSSKFVNSSLKLTILELAQSTSLELREPEEAEATDAVTNGEVHEMEKGDLPMTIEANLLSFVFLKILL